MAFSHGKDAEVLYGTLAMAPYLRSTDTETVINLSDATVYGDQAEAFLPGAEMGSLSLGGLMDDSTAATGLRETLEARRQEATITPMSVAPAGFTVGLGTVSAPIKYATFGHGLDRADLAAFTFKGTASGGGVDLGVSLHAIAAETAADVETSVDQTAQSTRGGVGYLHVTAFTGTSIDIVIQDSANDSTWADLVTFSSVTGVTSERVALGSTATVERYVRAEWSGTFTTCTFAVSWARR